MPADEQCGLRAGRDGKGKKERKLLALLGMLRDMLTPPPALSPPLPLQPPSTPVYAEMHRRGVN